MQLARAALPFLLRLGSGGFVNGYRSTLERDDGTYGVVKLAGRKVWAAADQNRMLLSLLRQYLPVGPLTDSSLHAATCPT